MPAEQLSSAGLESFPPKNKSAPGVLPSFLEVPSEVPGEEVLVQTKVTQIAPAAPNVVGDLQEAGRGGTSQSRKSPPPGAGEERAAPTKSLSLATSSPARARGPGLRREGNSCPIPGAIRLGTGLRGCHFPRVTDFVGVELPFGVLPPNCLCPRKEATRAQEHPTASAFRSLHKVPSPPSFLRSWLLVSQSLLSSKVPFQRSVPLGILSEVSPSVPPLSWQLWFECPVDCPVQKNLVYSIVVTRCLCVPGRPTRQLLHS